MRRALFSGAFLFVEGESDERLFRRFVVASSSQLIIAFSRANAIEACRILHESGFDGVIGIVDSDFDFLDDVHPPAPNIFYTDCHDIECLMLRSSAFETVLSQYVSNDKISTWIASNGPDIRNHLLQGSMVMGSLLRHSNAAKLNLTFNSMEVKEFIDINTLAIDRTEYVRHIKNKSGRHDIADIMLLEAIDCILGKGPEHWYVTCGHHYVLILGYALRKALGTCDALDVTPERIEQSLRLAYSFDEFRGTALYADIKAWQVSHSPFIIFP